MIFPDLPRQCSSRTSLRHLIISKNSSILLRHKQVGRSRPNALIVGGEYMLDELSDYLSSYDMHHQFNTNYMPH